MTSPTTGAATPVRSASRHGSALRRGGRPATVAPSERPAPLAGEVDAVDDETRSKAAAYLALTKPRIIELLLVTTVPMQVVAARGLPSGWLVLWTVLGGALAAGGANSINMVVDRDIDRLMKRTQNRPLVTGEITPRAALIFAIGLEVAAFALLWGAVNLLSAVLAVSATLFYVFVYTLWLKRTSKQNIVIGGAAGAAPVLIGWTSVTGSLAWAPVVGFVIIFLWTPPHFWCLAVRYRDDYANAEVPMLPVVSSMRAVTLRIVAYTAVLWATTLVFAPVADMGTLYLVSAVVLGGVYLALTIDLARDPDPAKAMRLFHWSITYVTLLFGVMALDQLLAGAS